MNISILINDKELIGILKQIFSNTPVVINNEAVNTLREKTEKITLEEMGFSVRVLNALRCFSITTVDKLLSCTPRFLSKIRNFGKHSLMEVERILRTNGYELGSLPSIWVLYAYREEAFNTNGYGRESFETEELAKQFVLTENSKIFNSK